MSELTSPRPPRANYYLALGMVLCGLLATGVGISCLVSLTVPPDAGPLLPTQAASIANSILEIRRLAFLTIAMGCATAVAGGMMLWKARRR